jgi:hypothetical protein
MVFKNLMGCRFHEDFLIFAAFRSPDMDKAASKIYALPFQLE